MAKKKENLAQKAQESQAEMYEEAFNRHPIVNAEIISLDFDGVKEQELKQLADDHNKLVVTKEKKSFDAGKKARLALRKERFSIQNIVKEKKAILNGVKKKIEDKAQEYIDIILPAEEHIDKQIKTIEEEEARIKEEKRIAEQLRKEKLRQDSIDFIEAYRKRVRECKTTKELTKLSKELENAVVPDFEDYTNSAVIHINNIIETEIPVKSDHLLKEVELKKEKEKREELEAQLKEYQLQEREQSANIPEELSKNPVTKSNSFTDSDKKSGDVYNFHGHSVIREYFNSIITQIPEFSLDDFEPNEPEHTLIKEVNRQLYDIIDFIKSEVDKIHLKT